MKQAQRFLRILQVQLDILQVLLFPVTMVEC